MSRTEATDVVFALRHDGTAKPGGDTGKVSKYEPYLQAQDLSYRIIYNPADLDRYNARVVHIINVDLPYENLAYVEAARRQSAAVVLSPIAHPAVGVRDFYLNGDDSFYKLSRASGLPFSRALALREFVKLARRRQWGSLSQMPHPLLNHVTAQKKLLEAVDLLLPMNDLEQAELASRSSSLPDSHTVPNGISFPESLRSASGRNVYDVAIVGRIEPRKNTLEVAQHLASSGLRAVFVGQANDLHGKYVATFRSLIDAHSELSWLGRVTPDQVRAILAETETYLNLSWFEVVSQADIEATSQGCRLTTTQHSFVAGHLDHVMTCDPLRLHREEHGDSFMKGIVADAKRPLVSWLPTWAEAATSLISAYRRAGVV